MSNRVMKISFPMDYGVQGERPQIGYIPVSVPELASTKENKLTLVIISLI